ncbi:MAG: hypothetical protein IKN05_07750, partial [Clostridia bacterium]|nr:hypothetical protein [Clostridia bacterium]
MINAGFQYAQAYAEGKTNGKVDMDVLNQCMASAAGSEIELGAYVDAAGTEYPNYLLIALEPINFADYVG